MPVVINGDTGITQAGEFNSDSTMGFKNRIINGAMVIDQRNAGASISATGYPVDRFGFVEQTSATFTAAQSTTAPAGFTNSLLLTIGTGASATSTQYVVLNQKIEGYNSFDFGFGTANAQNATLSFWVRSSVTGIYCATLKNTDGSRTYIKEYTVSVANTWEYKTITFPGDTSGTWGTSNGVGLSVYFDFGSGSGTPTGTADSWITTNATRTSNQTDFINNSGATFYITGVQLEKGSTATSFDYRTYGTELALCQRYYFKNLPGAVNASLNAIGWCNGTTNADLAGSYPVTMRTAPTALEQSGTAGNYKIVSASGTADCSSVPTFGTAIGTTQNGYGVRFTVASGLTDGRGAHGLTGATTGASGYLAWSAEL